MKKLTSKKIQTETGSVKLTWKTVKTLAKVIDGFSSEFTKGWGESRTIDFDKVRESDLASLTSCSESFDYDTDDEGHKKRTKSSIMTRQGWCGREFAKLEKLGLIDWIDWDRWEWGCVKLQDDDEKVREIILHFEGIVTESDLAEEKELILDELVFSVMDSIDKIKKLGLVQSDKCRWSPTTAEQKIETEVREKVVDAILQERKDRQAKSAKAAKIAKLKKEIKALQA